MSASWTYTVRKDEKPESAETLLDAIPGLDKDARVLWVVPHDDDAVIGSGLLMQAMIDAGVQVDVLISTNGMLGYCREEHKETIAQIRAQETLNSFDIIGLPHENVHVIGYPDGALETFAGVKFADDDNLPQIEGFSGLSAFYTYWLRKIRPTHIFTPASSDLHPDHQTVYRDILISLFHSSGVIWPSLGKPCDVPILYEYPLYVNLSENPTLRVESSDDVLQTKLKSIEAYESQEQIASLVNNLRAAGAVEYYRCVNVEFYHPSNYEGLF